MEFLQAIGKFTEWRKFKVGKFTLKGYDSYLRRFCVFLRDPLIENITLDDLTQWLLLNEKAGYDLNSFIPMAEAIRQFFRFFQKLGYKVIDPDLVPIPRKEQKLPIAATSEEYQAILNASYNRLEAGQRNRAILGLLWDTGARLGEVLSLNILDLQLHKAIIRTEKSRGRRPYREIFWTSHTQTFVDKWLEARKGFVVKWRCDLGALFISLKGEHLGERLCNYGVYAFLEDYSKAAGLPRTVNAHSFRHHKAHEIIRRNGSAADIMNVLGHASITSSSVYMQMAGRELQERAKKFLDNG